MSGLRRLEKKRTSNFERMTNSDLEREQPEPNVADRLTISITLVRNEWSGCGQSASSAHTSAPRYVADAAGYVQLDQNRT